MFYLTFLYKAFVYICIFIYIQYIFLTRLLNNPSRSTIINFVHSKICMIDGKRNFRGIRAIFRSINFLSRNNKYSLFRVDLYTPIEL